MNISDWVALGIIGVEPFFSMFGFKRIKENLNPSKKHRARRGTDNNGVFNCMDCGKQFRQNDGSKCRR